MNAGKKYSDEEIVSGILRNDITVLEYFYSEHYRSVRHYVISNSGTEEDAKDIFQEALVVFYRKLKDPAFTLTSSSGTFIYAIAKLMWLKELSVKARRKLDVADSLDAIFDSDDNILELIEQNERLRLYREKFEELSDDCKRVLHLFLNNIPIREITRLMGYSSEQHTKNRRFRCKKSLMQKIRNSSDYKELGHEEDIDN